jgi:ATP/maltotriose-dependent transcriptional regulator MalT
MVDKLVELLIQKSEFPINFLISDRELEVLTLIQNGYSNSQIGKHLFLSENTIKTHIKHIYKKMSVSNRREAIEKGILWGILK